MLRYNSMSTDAIVVGGGVIGCTIAWRLAQQGLKVTLFERGKVGDEASRAAAGMLSPQAESHSKGPFFDLCLKSRLMYRKFAYELSDVSGIDVEYNDSGTLFVVLSGEDDEETTRWAAWQTEAGLPLQPFSEDDLRRIEPAVTESAARAIFLPEDHQVENRRLMDSLKIAIKLAGVDLIEDAEVTSLATAQDRVTGVVSAGKRFDAGSVIVAAGTWSSRLLEPLGLNVRVIPARGQMIAVKGDGCPITRVVHSSSVYVVPRRDGRILIGATVEYTGFKKEVTVSAINHLLKAGLELVPSLGQFAVVETWSGLRPDTIDHLPIIGPSGIDNLILATGHFRNGILLAPVTAELVADTVVQGRVSDDLKPFGVSRLDA